MKSNTFYIIKILKSILFLLIIITFLLFQYYHQESVATIFAETPQILKSSIKEYVDSLSNNQQQFIRYNYQPNKHKIGEYVTKKYMTADTTIIYQAKIVDYETHIFNSNQTTLAAKKELHPQPIQHLFDSLLKENNIYHTQTAIGVTYSVLSNFHEWSGDSTSLSIDQRISFTKQGNFEDINYYAYIDYSFLTFWKAMPKGLLFTLIAINFILIILIGVFYHRKRKEKRSVTPLEEKQVPVNDILREIKPPRQQQQLLNLFLEAENYRVKKDIIKKEFWPDHVTDATTNMTTAIKRLRDFLHQNESGYTIISDPEDDGYYLLLSSKPSPDTNDQNENETTG